jgi:hypothetical protein
VTKFLTELLHVTVGVIDDEERKQFYLIGPKGEMVLFTFDEFGDESIEWQEVPVC